VRGAGTAGSEKAGVGFDAAGNRMSGSSKRKGI
jgi:hypothetical protein